jgi:hypothetical protein
MVKATYSVRVHPGAPALQFQISVTPQGGPTIALPVSDQDALVILPLLLLPGHLLFDQATGTLMKNG